MHFGFGILQSFGSGRNFGSKLNRKPKSELSTITDSVQKIHIFLTLRKYFFSQHFLMWVVHGEWSFLWPFNCNYLVLATKNSFLLDKQDILLRCNLSFDFGFRFGFRFRYARSFGFGFGSDQTEISVFRFRFKFRFRSITIEFISRSQKLRTKKNLFEL